MATVHSPKIGTAQRQNQKNSEQRHKTKVAQIYTEGWPNRCKKVRTQTKYDDGNVARVNKYVFIGWHPICTWHHSSIFESIWEYLRVFERDKTTKMQTKTFKRKKGWQTSMKNGAPFQGRGDPSASSHGAAQFGRGRRLPPWEKDLCLNGKSSTASSINF